MKDFLDRIKDLPPKKLALLAAQLQERLERAEAAGPGADAIAIVGVGCRFPGGADDPESYWQLMVDGRDAISEVPADRWDAAAFYDEDWQADGKMATRWGGFLDGIDRFDARLFGISRREAVSMDPQQRLLLEVSWQALERAGIAPSSLAGTRTGVFVGVSATDYLQLQVRRGVGAIDGYLASGAAPSVAAGRISYVLGLQGPALSIDTACSSSLVAVHLAVQSLRSRQCDAALAAGVNVILSPVTTIALSKSQMMAPDGRCKTFSARADGFVRGEGCGVVVLKRLADAQRDGDRIVGVIRGSAVNQDGRSNGLTAPNGPSQEAVLAAALADAGVAPAEIGYVEAHGTGTRLGDPIEVQALGAVLGRGRTADGRLRIGSVKTNIGHLESAAGIAGLIKAVLVLEHGTIPPHQHLDELSPVIPWASLPIDVPTEMTAWSAHQPRLAGVSSFGFSGTNAHIVLEAAPTEQDGGSDESRSVEVLALSAQSEVALDELERQLGQHLADHDLPLADVCATVNTGRDAFAHRQVVVAASMAELRDELLARGRGGESRRVHRAHVTGTRPPRPVWLFTGQGSQYPGMGRELARAEPVVADVLDRCDAFLRSRFDLPLLDVMWAADDPRIHQTAFTQPALFALEVALAALWRSWGVQAAAVVGHSVGEYAAAHVAGLFDLEDGLSLVANRGRLMQALPADGRMVALVASPDRVEAALASHAATVSIAAVNGPDSVVISGAAAGVQSVLDALGQGVHARDLEVSHPFHSPAMDPIVDELAAVAAGVTFGEPTIPIISNVFGEAAGRDRLGTARYWARHARDAVQFGPAMAALASQGHRLFLEIGPHPTLVGMAARGLAGPEFRWVHSLRRDRADEREIATAVGQLWLNGVTVDWSSWHGGPARRRPILPTYPMQRERFWIEGAAPWGDDPAQKVDLDGLVYDVTWRTQAHSSATAASDLAPVPEIAIEVDTVAPSVAAANEIAGYDEFLPRLDELCAAYVLDGFGRLGLDLRPGARATTDAIATALGILPNHQRQLRRLLQILEEDGWLRAEGDAWVVVRGDAPAPAALSADLGQRAGRFRAELDLIDRCGTQLPDLLRGTVDVLEVLFPGGSSAQMEGIYRDSPMARTFNELVGRAVAAAIAPVPADRRIRILEVGAGSGATTESVLAVLGGRDVDYTFTDISPSFTTKARRRFRDTPFVRSATLDASVDPETQGFAPAGYDVIVAANVVHATPNLEVTLRHLRQLLAPGGQLVLLEATTRERFSDLTVGFTPGWWAFEDVDRRPDYALLSRDGWQDLLGATGFGPCAVAPSAAGTSSLRREAVVLASAPSDGPEPVHVAQRWVLVGDGPLHAAVADALEQAGDSVATVAGADRPAVASTVSAGDTAGVLIVVDDADADAAPDAVRRRHEDRTATVLGAIQGVLDTPTARPVWIVTRGAQAVGTHPVPDPEAATVWGIGHVVELEHPELRCRCIDVGPGPLADAAARVLTELHDPDPGEPQVAWRDGERLVRRLRPATVPVGSLTLDADASYIVSGGLRGLGLLVAGWMVEHGARSIVLFGRRQPDDAAAAAIEGWRARGVVVVVEQADAADDADMARVVALANSLAPLRGVIHGAGALADAALLRQDWGHFATVYGAKVFGTASLLRHLDLHQLDFLAFFASGVGVGGAPGQANHAAANAYLDALAHQLRQAGVPAVSIDWGAWTDIGAAADRGIDSMPGAFSPEQGLAVLDGVLAAVVRKEGPAQLVVHSPDWSDLQTRFPAGTEPSLYRDLFAGLRAATPLVVPAARVPAAATSRRSELLALPERRRRIALRDEVRRLAARVLDADDVEQIELDQPLHDLGLDSLMAVELRNLLGVAIEAELPATLLYEQPSVSALVDHLLADYLAAPEPTPPAVLAAAPSAADVDIVVSDAAEVDDLAAALAARLDRLGKA